MRAPKSVEHWANKAAMSAGVTVGNGRGVVAPPPLPMLVDPDAKLVGIELLKAASLIIESMMKSSCVEPNIPMPGSPPMDKLLSSAGLTALAAGGWSKW